MDIRIALFAAAALLAQPALAASAYTSNHPEEAYPDAAPLTTPGPYTDFIKEVQTRLHEAGFDAGPVNGEMGAKSQAALGQYQISQNIPASGALDKQTLDALGVRRPEL